MKKLSITLLIYSTSILASTPPLEKVTLCDSTKEYVATLEFLREQKELGLKDTDARKVADKVSLGCKGAFNRFAKVSSMLSRVGIDSGTSVNHGVQFAATTDEKAHAFIEIFQQSYDQDVLDLDPLNCLKISMQLSETVADNSKNILSDFKKLVKFCLDDKNLGLSNGQCAELSAKITSLGGKFGQTLSDQYIELIRFISDDKKGPQVDKKQAIDLADQTIANGPAASTNFINAYKYGVSKKGLALAGKDALEFAGTMAKRSYQLESKN